MCGIAGIVNRSPDHPVDPHLVARMCAAIAYRGPDDQGVMVAGNVGLGMRRLSIIDVEGGQQPIHNEDQTVWVVFNGEIYNFPELRRELESRGHRFYTHSDTEVIVHSYEEFGSDCVQHLRGMFGFALYDQRQELLLLARDRVGIKPLHYAHTAQGIAFASEIKSLLEVFPELKEVNSQSLVDYFCFGYIPDDDNTCFRNIFKLPPGHRLIYQRGRMRIEQYWDIPQYATHRKCSEEELLEELEHLLYETVNSHLISDVPIGALLSGGVDSSVVVALASRAVRKPLVTFSIGFSHSDFDERCHAREVAQVFGTDHHELVLDPDIVDLTHKLTSSLEEPFADSSMIPTFCVSQMARRHVTVAISGDGGDELFAGYDRYRVNMRRRIFGLIPSSVGKLYRELIFPHLPRTLLGRKLSFNVSLPFLDRYLDSIAVFPAGLRDCGIFSPEFLRQIDPLQPLERFRAYFDHAPAGDLLSRLLYLDTKTYLAGDILTKIDRMSMLNSLEVRPPILDHRVVEWAASLPPEYKLRKSQSKYLLKRLARKLGVPGTVIDRPKRGFAMPLEHWFRAGLRELAQETLLDSQALQRGYFRPGRVRQLLDEHFSGVRNYAGEIWMLLVFELWHRNFPDHSVGGKVQMSARPASILVGQEASTGSPARQAC
jgi:asparagine synthase (glutamine-hydrolysing)